MVQEVKIERTFPPPKGRQVDYIWHSNRIDFNTVLPEQLTREIVANRESAPTEIQDHWLALEWMMLEAQTAYVRKPLISDVARELHHKLMMNLLPAGDAGEYRAENVWIGRGPAPNHELIPAYMKRLDVMDRMAKTEADAWRVHDEFECIHPFVDGNGRTGRLLLSYVRLRLGFSLYTVTYGREGTQYEYYRRIQQYRADVFNPLETK